MGAAKLLKLSTTTRSIVFRFFLRGNGLRWSTNIFSMDFFVTSELRHPNNIICAGLFLANVWKLPSLSDVHIHILLNELSSVFCVIYILMPSHSRSVEMFRNHWDYSRGATTFGLWLWWQPRDTFFKRGAITSCCNFSIIFINSESCLL